MQECPLGFGLAAKILHEISILPYNSLRVRLVEEMEKWKNEKDLGYIW